MSLELPSYLDWLGYLVGVEWPEGDEDQMWALAEDWRTAANGLREQVSSITDAKSATLAAYVNGDGVEAMSKLFDQLAGAGGGGDGTSILDLAKHFEQLGDSVEESGTEIQYTKLMFYSSLVMAAGEIAAAWLWPPTAPAVEAVVVTMTRIAVRIIGREALDRMLAIAAKMGITAVVKFALKHMVLNTVLGTLQDYGIQQYQVDTGHRKSVNWTQVGVTAISSGVGGAVAGPLGGALGDAIGNRVKTLTRNPALQHYITAGLTGASAGIIGGGAGFVGATAAQFGFDWAENGWDKAVNNLEHTQFDIRMLTAGAFNGGVSGLNHTAAHSFWEPRMALKTSGIGATDLTSVGGHPALDGPGGTHGGTNGVDGPRAGVAPTDTGTTVSDGSTSRPETAAGTEGGSAPANQTGAQLHSAGTTAPTDTHTVSEAPGAGDTNGRPQSSGDTTAAPSPAPIHPATRETPVTETPSTEQTVGGTGSATTSSGSPSATSDGPATGGATPVTSSSYPSAVGGPSGAEATPSTAAGSASSAPSSNTSPGPAAGDSTARAGAPTASPTGSAGPGTSGAGAASAPGTTTAGTGAGSTTSGGTSGPSASASASAAAASNSPSGVAAASAGNAARAATPTGSTQHLPGTTQSPLPETRATAPRPDISRAGAPPEPRAATDQPSPAPADRSETSTPHPAPESASTPDIAGEPGISHSPADTQSPRSDAHQPEGRSQDQTSAGDESPTAHQPSDARPPEPPESRQPTDNRAEETPEARQSTEGRAEDVPGERQPTDGRAGEAPEPRQSTDGPAAGETEPQQVARGGDEQTDDRYEGNQPTGREESSTRAESTVLDEPESRRPVDDSVESGPRDDEPVVRGDEELSGLRDNEPRGSREEGSSAAHEDEHVTPREDEHATPREDDPSASRENDPSSSHEERIEEPRGDEPVARDDVEPAGRNDDGRALRESETSVEPGARLPHDEGNPADRELTARDHGTGSPEGAGEPRRAGEMPQSEGAALPHHEDVPAETRDGSMQSESESAGPERESTSDRERQQKDPASPEDALLVAPMPLGETPNAPAAEGDRARPSEPHRGGEAPGTGPVHPEKTPATDARRGTPPERTDGHKPHPGRVDDPSSTPAREPISLTADEVRERNRGRCGELALRLLRQLTGNKSIVPPERRVGPEGMRIEELVAGAGGRLETFPDGHDAIAARLRDLGDGASAMVVDQYAGAADEHGVGAHAYLLVNRGGEIKVIDPGAGLVHGYPPEIPRETKGTHAILFDSEGKPVRPLKNSVRAGLMHLANEHVGDAAHPPADKPRPPAAAPPEEAGDPKTTRDDTLGDEPTRPLRRSGRQQEEPPPEPRPDTEPQPDTESQRREDRPTGPEDLGQEGVPEYLDQEHSHNWSPRPDDHWSRMDRDEIVHDLDERLGVEVRGAEHLDPEALREFARAIEDVVNQYPIDVRGIEIGGTLHNAGALMEAVPRVLESGRIVVDRIAVNVESIADPTAFAGVVRNGEAIGWAPTGAGDRPLYAVFVHELGHALDFAGGTLARDQVDYALADHYRRTRGEVTPLEYLEWLSQLSNYSFTRDGDVNRTEALADAFMDVVLNGDNATEPAKVLHRLLLDHTANAGHPEAHDPIGERPAHDDGHENHSQEPEFGPQPPESAPAIVDHWTDLDHQAVLDRIQHDLGIEPVGFHLVDDVEVLREVGRALEDSLAENPGIKPKQVVIGPIPTDPDAMAVTFRRSTQPDGVLIPHRIVFNEEWARNPAAFAERIRAQVAAGHHVPGSDARPVYALVVHEYGHVLDHYGQLEARAGLLEDLIHHFVATHEEGDFTAVQEWLRGQLPGYAFDEHGMLNAAEALAEGYRDVMLNGDNASELSKIMAHRLKIAAQDAAGLHPPDTAGHEPPGDPLGARDPAAESPEPHEPPAPQPEPSPEPLGLQPKPSPEPPGPQPEPRTPEELWFDRRMAERADFNAQMADRRAEFLHSLADTAIPGSFEEQLLRDQARHAEGLAQQARDHADSLWTDLGGRPDENPTATSPEEAREADHPAAQQNHSGDGRPPTEPPSRPRASSDDPDGWFDRMRAEQADWDAHMDAKRAEWFHEMADREEPGSQAEREARFEAHMADAEADLSRIRADFMWDLAGGRPDPTTNPTHPDTPPHPATSKNPDETPTVKQPRPEGVSPDETPTVELPHSESAGPDPATATESQRQEGGQPHTLAPKDPVEASPGLHAAVEQLRDSTPEAGERPRSVEDLVYGVRLTDALGIVEALAKRPDALAALRGLAEAARAAGVFDDPASGLGERPQHAPAGEPRTLTLEELRGELLRRLGLPDTVADDVLPRAAGDLQLRNLLRAGGIEALRDAVLAHDSAAGPERARLARTRDDWARKLGVDPALLDPEHTTPAQRRDLLDELRAETLRRASDVADLMVATFHTPGADHVHVVLEADGERVHIRMTEDADGHRRAEIIERPDLPRETPAKPTEPEAKKPGWLKRLWRRMMHGYDGQSPKYPSGSGNDSKGQTMLAMEIGYVTHDEALLHLKDKFNPARILKETATLWKDRERLPLVKHLTARVADAAAEAIPMRTRDGGEYRPWVTEADPRMRAEIEESLRLAGLPIESEMPEPQHEPLDRGPALEPPGERHWGTELPQPLVDAVTARDAALADLVRLAREAGIDIPADDPHTLRAVLDEAVYRLMRRAGAIEALRDAGERWLLEDSWVPFSREISIFDKDPLGRYLREFAHSEAIRVEEDRAAARRAAAGVGPDDDSLEYRPREPRPSFLDLQGVNNGGEWPRHFDDPGEELSNRREGRLFEDALRRDQIQDERSNWAQLLDVGLDRLATEADLRRAVAELRMDVRDQADHLNQLSSAIDHFVELDTQARQHADAFTDVAAQNWVRDHGGVMLDREHGLAVLPGHPQRLVVIRGELDHDVRLLDALVAHPEIREQLNRGELQLDYRLVGLDQHDRTRVLDLEPPQVRFHEVDVEGERSTVALMRNGLEPWRIVQPTPETAAPHSESHTAPAESRDPDVVRAERNEVASRLSVYRMDLGANLAETIAALRHDNALRAAQIEGMADFIRSSDAIDSFHDLDRTLQALAHRLGIDPAELTPRRLAEAMADPAVRKVRRLQAVDDLIKYAKALRENVDEATVLDARKDLARKLGVEPQDLAPAKPAKEDGQIVGFAPDLKNTDKKALLAAINELLHESATRPELLAALTEYGSVLGEVDPFRQRLRFDPSTDPRAVDGELPIHDADAPALLRALRSDSLGEPPASDNPSAAAGVWSRLLGVQMNDFDKTVKIYRDQLGGLHDRLSPNQFADVLTTLRETGDLDLAYQRYRDSAADPAAVFTKEQVKDLVRGVRNARYGEVYEAYRDGKIEKHERLSAKELAATVDSLRAEVRARAADIDLLESLAAEHNRLTDPPQPVAAARDPRTVATDLAAARHDAQLAREGRDHARGRVYREDGGAGLRPIADSDLTPGRVAGTTDYLANRPAEEGGSLPGLDRRLTDLATAADDFDRAQARVADLESELRRSVEADPNESPVTAWQREIDTARAELEALIAADPALARQGFEAILDQVDRMSRMPHEWGDVWTDDLVPLRDAVHRYEQAREFHAAAQRDEAAAARAAETPEQTTARELSTARSDLDAAHSAGDAEAATAAQERVSRWEAEQRLLDAQTAAAADTPHQAADRARAAALADLRAAIAEFRDVTGLDVTEADLTEPNLRATLDRLLPQAGGNLPDLVRAFDKLQSAAEAFHPVDAMHAWVHDTMTPVPETGGGDPHAMFARQVETALAAGETHVTVLSEGVMRMAKRVELVTFDTDPPTQLIRKVVNNPRHATAETLVALIGQAVGAKVPMVHQVDEHTVYMQVMPGDLGSEHFVSITDAGLDAVLSSPDGRRLGLLDVLIGMPDRNFVNWLLSADGSVSGIDHSLAFGGGRRGDELTSRPFARHFAERGPDGETIWHNHDLTAADLAEARARLEALAPVFDEHGHPDWHRAMMDRLAELERHARPNASGDDGESGTPARDPGGPTKPGSDPEVAPAPELEHAASGGQEPPNRPPDTPSGPEPEDPNPRPGNDSGDGSANATPEPEGERTRELPPNPDDVPTAEVPKPGQESTLELPKSSEDSTLELPRPGEDSTLELPPGEDSTLELPPPGEDSTLELPPPGEDSTLELPPPGEDATAELPAPGEDSAAIVPVPHHEATLELPTAAEELPPVDPVADSPTLKALAEFLQGVRDAPDSHGRGVDEVVYVARLLDALGLDAATAHLNDPLTVLRAVAEMARARGFFGDPEQGAPARPMREADDYRDLTPEEIYGDEEFWRTEADPADLLAIETALREAGLNGELPPGRTETTRPLDPAPEATGTHRDAASTHPEGTGSNPESRTQPIHPGGDGPTPERPLEPWSQRPHDPNAAEPRVLTLDELRQRLADEFGLSADDLSRENLPLQAGEMQFRNLLRAGALEALADILTRHDAATGAEREHLARVRDDWARKLGIPEAALDPETTTPEQRKAVLDAQRAETLRRAMDVADLMVAALHVPAADHAHVVLEAEGERVHARVVEKPDGSKRIELVSRPDLGEHRPGAKPKDNPGWLQRVWRRMMHGFHAQSPKYPSGSGNDSKGQTMLAMEIGYATHDEALLHLKDKFNPVRIAKEVATLWKAREDLPLVNKLTRRIADISPDLKAMRTRQGGEYRPWITEADPRLRAEVEESLRLAGLPIESEMPEPHHDPLGPESIQEPPPRRWSTDLPQPLVDSVEARDAALLELVRAAHEHGIVLEDADPRSLRRAVQELHYRAMRRAGAIEGLRDAAQRWLMEDGVVPFSHEVSLLDKDPLGRYVRELALVEALNEQEQKALERRIRAGVGLDHPGLEFRPRDPRVSALDFHGVNNGGEWVLHFDDIDDELSSSREGRLFEDALRRDQIQEERSNWAQLLDVGLDTLATPEDLAHTVADLRVGVRDELARAAAFAEVVDRFLGADTEFRQRADEASAAAARDWVDANGGKLLDREHGLAILPGEHGAPERLVVIRGDNAHDIHLVDALAAHPDVRELVNRGALHVDYRAVSVNDAGRVQVEDLASPNVRFHEVAVDGRQVPVALLREGLDSWRIVQPTSEPVAAPHTEPPATGPRDPDTVRIERNEVAARLAVYEMDLGANLEETILGLRQHNALSLAQLEGMADYIRTSDAIDTFNDLDRALGNLANRLRLDPEQLSPRAIAEALADQRIRMGERRRQAFANLVEYADVLRKNVDEGAALAARDKLARALGVDPDALHKQKAVKDDRKVDIIGWESDRKSTVPDALAEAFENLIFRPDERRAAAIDALTEYVGALAVLDPHRDSGMRYDPLTDPRAVSGDLPVHDPDAPGLLHALASDAIGEPPLTDNPSGAAAMWSRLLGVDVGDIGKTVKIYDERLSYLHDRMTPGQLRDVLTTLDETRGDKDAAYRRYLDSVSDPAKAFTSEQVSDIVRVVERARYAEVYEAYRDGKIEKHERLTPKELAAAVEAIRAELHARAADIDLLERLATEHHDLTNPPEPAAPPRDPRIVGPELAAARHELQVAREGLDYAKGRMYREADGGEFRPLRDSDLTPEHLPGTENYLETRNRAEGGELPGHAQRIEDLTAAASEFDRAQARVAALEAELHDGVRNGLAPGETPVDAWRREVEAARTDLEALVGDSSQAVEHAVDQVDRMSKMPLTWDEVWTDELIPVRDAVHRYQRGQEFLHAAETTAATEAEAAARAAETPQQRTARELDAARADLDAAIAVGDDPARQSAADRLARWEVEQQRLTAEAAAAADTPQSSAHRDRHAAQAALTAAIEHLHHATGLTVTEPDLTPDRLHTTLTDLLTRAGGNLPEAVRAFDHLQHAAETLHAAEAMAAWMDEHYPDAHRPDGNETGGTPTPPGPEKPPSNAPGSVSPASTTGEQPLPPREPNPGAAAVTHAPEAAGTDVPEGAGIHVPEGAGTDVPEGAGTHVPEGAGTHVPEGAGTHVPEGAGTHVPEGAGTHVPEGGQHSAPPANTAEPEPHSPDSGSTALSEQSDGRTAAEWTAGAETVHTWSDPSIATWADGVLATAREHLEQHRAALAELAEIARGLGQDPTGLTALQLEQRLLAVVDAEIQRQQGLMETPAGMSPDVAMAQLKAADQQVRDLTALRSTINAAVRTGVDALSAAQHLGAQVQDAAIRDVLTAAGADIRGPGVGILPGQPPTILIVSPRTDPLTVLGEPAATSLTNQGVPIHAKLLEVDFDGTIHLTDLQPPATPTEPTTPPKPISPPEPTTPPESTTPTEPTTLTEPTTAAEPTAPVEPSTPVEPTIPVEPTTHPAVGPTPQHSEEPKPAQPKNAAEQPNPNERAEPDSNAHEPLAEPSDEAHPPTDPPVSGDRGDDNPSRPPTQDDSAEPTPTPTQDLGEAPKPNPAPEPEPASGADAGGGDREQSVAGDDRYRYNPNWRSHLPFPYNPYNPEFPEYTPRPPEQPAPWTLPPEQTHQPHQPQHPGTPGHPHHPTSPGGPSSPNGQHPHFQQQPQHPQHPNRQHQYPANPQQQWPQQQQWPHQPQWPSTPTMPPWHQNSGAQNPRWPSEPGVSQSPQWPTLPGTPETPQWPTVPGSRQGSQWLPTSGAQQNPQLPARPDAPTHQPSTPGSPQALPWNDGAGGPHGLPGPGTPPGPNQVGVSQPPRWPADAGVPSQEPSSHAAAQGSSANGSAGQGLPGGSPMMSPGGHQGAGNGNSRGTSRFPRASAGPAQGGQIYLRQHSGYGEYAWLDPATGRLSSAPMGPSAPAGVFDDLDGLRVAFYRDPQAGLVVRIGDQVIEVDRLGAGALWERVGADLHRLVIGSPGDVRCELRYRALPADADLGLLIRDVLSDPSRRFGIFG
ncbi:hypothetical protein D7D52_28220 [Nocardia yunnanensis]|uniref:Tox-PL domain-containing protein n=1 Tax=Nocardia yunnanensis TaxID=2382165 RepID=A0A386ZGL8_9NOCA|nr:hypothetical protein [Nocardia yunnanensis]AYF77052.1 hypothetical protein D7D52_28220 [Nocardia yunnanensis]